MIFTPNSSKQVQVILFTQNVHTHNYTSKIIHYNKLHFKSIQFYFEIQR